MDRFIKMHMKQNREHALKIVGLLWKNASKKRIIFKDDSTKEEANKLENM